MGEESLGGFGRGRGGERVVRMAGTATRTLLGWNGSRDLFLLLSKENDGPACLNKVASIRSRIRS